MNVLKKCFDSFRKKLSYVLKWSPVSCVYSFSGTRLQLFSSYHEHILNENLQYIYMINTSLGISILLFHLLYVWLNQQIFDMKIDIQTYVALPLAVVSILYHGSVFILLKVNRLKKWIQKIAGLLNLVSLLVLHFFLGSFFLRAKLALSSNSTTNPLSLLDARVTAAAFEGSVATFYFQNSFVISGFIWLALAGGTSLGDLQQMGNLTDETAAVVSWCWEIM